MVISRRSPIMRCGPRDRRGSNWSWSAGMVIPSGRRRPINQHGGHLLMSILVSLPNPLFAGHLQAAADVVRVGVGYVPPALTLLLQDARAGRVPSRSQATLKRLDAVWALV